VSCTKKNDQNIFVPAAPIHIKTVPQPLVQETDPSLAAVINSIIAAEGAALDASYAGRSAESDITVKLTRDDSQWFSYYYYGLIVTAGAAYPQTILWPVIIDKTKGQKVLWSDIASLSDTTYQREFIQSLSLQFQRLEIDITDIFPEESLPTVIERAVNAYLTDTKAVVLVEVPHVLGDFIEVSVPF
jgi:hypothetical protein